MAKRYFIDLSRKDIGLGSYFPGLELRSTPQTDWIEAVLVPAISPLLKRKAKAIYEVPITFWVTVRQTARPYRAEIFLFITPAYPGVQVERALSRLLQPITAGNVFAGREHIPAEAVPCCQLFRGRLLMFYFEVEDVEDSYLPIIQWRDGAPVLALSDIPKASTEIVDDESEKLLVRANISEVLDGGYYRKLQQAISTIARTED